MQEWGYGEEVLLGVLLRCAPPAIRQHLTLTMTDRTDCCSAKEILVAYERSSKTWGTQSLMKQVSHTHGSVGKAFLEICAEFVAGETSVLRGSMQLASTSASTATSTSTTVVRLMQ